MVPFAEVVVGLNEPVAVMVVLRSIVHECVPVEVVTCRVPVSFACALEVSVFVETVEVPLAFPKAS